MEVKKNEKEKEGSERVKRRGGEADKKKMKEKKKKGIS